MISAISVKDRLKNQAVVNGKTFQEALTAYGLERTVYRLSVSEYETVKADDGDKANSELMYGDIKQFIMRMVQKS